MNDEISIFNVVGLPNEEFIGEVTVADARVRNEVYFALGVNGLPGDPSFGVALLDVVGELLDTTLKKSISNKLKKLDDYLTTCTYIGHSISFAVRSINVDVYVRDNTTQALLLVPVALPRGN